MKPRTMVVIVATLLILTASMQVWADIEASVRAGR